MDKRTIIDSKFEEWTRDRSLEESRIRIFEKIRDIPFAVVPEFFSLEKGPAEMLIRNKGFCVPKHYLLGMMYRNLGAPVRYCTYSFRWSKLDVDYPAAMAKLADNAPVTYHLACEVFIDDEWVLVDATWDPALKKAGFPVNENWDGKSSLVNAVKPLEEFIHEDAREREKMFREKLSAYSLSEKLDLSRFSGGLNRWLEEVRVRPAGPNP